MTLADPVQFNELRLANALPSQAMAWFKQGFGLNEATILPSLETEEIAKAGQAMRGVAFYCFALHCVPFSMFPECHDCMAAQPDSHVSAQRSQC